MKHPTQPPLVPVARGVSTTVGGPISGGLIFAALLATSAFAIVLAGCGKKNVPDPTIGHSSYELGRLKLDQTNAEVLSEFVMPRALNVCVCLVLEGVDQRNAVQMDNTTRDLGSLKVKLELSNSAQPALIINNVLGRADLGHIANWHSPDAVLGLNQPLISYGDGGPVRRQGPHNDSSAIAVRPGERYRLSLRVMEAGRLTNQVSVRLDHWGTSMNGTN